MTSYKRKFDYNTASTYEIKKYREEQLENEKKEMIHDSIDLTELMPMTAEQMQSYVLSADTICGALCKILNLKTFQKRADPVFIQILEVHVLSKFEEAAMLQKLLKDNVQHAQAFMNRIIRYMAVFCYKQENFKDIKAWATLFYVKSEMDFARAFQQSTGKNNLERQLLATMVMLVPETGPKYAGRVFSLLVKHDELPGCFYHLAQAAFKDNVVKDLKIDDVKILVHKFFKKCYEDSLKIADENEDVPKKDLTEAQSKFVQNTHAIANDAFRLIQPSDDRLFLKLFRDPSHKMERPSDLNIEYILQYIKLGVFSKYDDKILAWNYYFDDRWCGYDREDLFGDNFKLSEQFFYEESFKNAKDIKKHPHHNNFMVLARILEWILDDEPFYATLMETHGDEKFLQYACIALCFSGRFDRMITFYEKVKDKATTRHSYMCIHTCYLYSLARTGALMEAIPVWKSIVDRAVAWKFTDTIFFSRKTFNIPHFVNIKYAAQVATRLIRNCMWTTAVKEGTEGWKKYALIIANICESMADTFLNHNMLRIMFQLMKVEDLHLFFQPSFQNCIVRRQSFNFIMSTVDGLDPKLLPSLREKGIKIPSSSDYPKPLAVKPGFLTVYEKLKNKDVIFLHIIGELPESVFETYKEPEIVKVITPKKSTASNPDRDALQVDVSTPRSTRRRYQGSKRSGLYSDGMDDPYDDSDESDGEFYHHRSDDNYLYGLMQEIDAAYKRKNKTHSAQSENSSSVTPRDHSENTDHAENDLTEPMDTSVAADDEPVQQENGTAEQSSARESNDDAEEPQIKKEADEEPVVEEKKTDVAVEEPETAKESEEPEAMETEEAAEPEKEPEIKTEPEADGPGEAVAAVGADGAVEADAAPEAEQEPETEKEVAQEPEAGEEAAQKPEIEKEAEVEKEPEVAAEEPAVVAEEPTIKIEPVEPPVEEAMEQEEAPVEEEEGPSDEGSLDRSRDEEPDAVIVKEELPDIPDGSDLE